MTFNPRGCHNERCMTVPWSAWTPSGERESPWVLLYPDQKGYLDGCWGILSRKVGCPKAEGGVPSWPQAPIWRYGIPARGRGSCTPLSSQRRECSSRSAGGTSGETPEPLPHSTPWAWRKRNARQRHKGEAVPAGLHPNMEQWLKPLSMLVHYTSQRSTGMAAGGTVPEPRFFLASPDLA